MTNWILVLAISMLAQFIFFFLLFIGLSKRFDGLKDRYDSLDEQFLTMLEFQGQNVRDKGFRYSLGKDVER